MSDCQCPSLALVNFRNEAFDIGIRTGPCMCPDVHAIELMNVHLTPLCSPHF